jgi:hypothetical protein
MPKKGASGESWIEGSDRSKPAYKHLSQQSRESSYSSVACCLVDWIIARVGPPEQYIPQKPEDRSRC